ncbi:hypothetical protein EDB87DRAFT_1687415 [Lactarius vividus]|nr:hypothetical protein EDB87DRAFT_1687415 [Lactarius vividus]
MTDIIVKIIIKVLTVLSMVEKEVGQGKTSIGLVGRKDVEDALQGLDQLTQEEVRIAIIEALRIARGIEDKMKSLNEGDADHKVGSVIEGVLCPHYPAPGSVFQPFTRLNVRENGAAIQQLEVVIRVSDINRS